MTILYWIAGFISIILMVYLFIALLQPERFK